MDQLIGLDKDKALGKDFCLVFCGFSRQHRISLLRRNTDTDMTGRNNWLILAEMSESQEESANPKVPSVEGRVKRLWRLGLSEIGLTWPILPSTSLPKISTGTHVGGRQCNETTSHPSDPLSVKPRRREPPSLRPHRKGCYFCTARMISPSTHALCWQPNHPRLLVRCISDAAHRGPRSQVEWP